LFEERYASVDVYLGRIAQAANNLVDQRLLLPEDVSGILRGAELHWRFATAEP
jgi:hypothetical protein